MPQFGRVLAALLLLLVFAPLDALAYIDPHAGGSLFQLLAPVIGMVVAAWVTMRRMIAAWLRSLWRRITGRQSE
jgi:hypothetical protein